MKVQKNIRQCEMCKDEEATTFCFECYNYFCEACFKYDMIEKRIVIIRRKKLIYLFLLTLYVYFMKEVH